MRCEHCGGTIWSRDLEGDTYCFMSGRMRVAVVNQLDPVQQHKAEISIEKAIKLRRLKAVS